MGQRDTGNCVETIREEGWDCLPFHGRNLRSRQEIAVRGRDSVTSVNLPTATPSTLVGGTEKGTWEKKRGLYYSESNFQGLYDRYSSLYRLVRGNVNTMGSFPKIEFHKVKSDVLYSWNSRWTFYSVIRSSIVRSTEGTRIVTSGPESP